MEVPLQRRSTPHGPGRLDAPSLRQPSCHSPRTCIGRGPQTGATPANPALNVELGLPRGGRSLDASVCAYAPTEPDLLVIPDLGADPRTRANSLVTGEPRICFYAGAPLRTPEGQHGLKKRR